MKSSTHECMNYLSLGLHFTMSTGGMGWIWQHGCMASNTCAKVLTQHWLTCPISAQPSSKWACHIQAKSWHPVLHICQICFKLCGDSCMISHFLAWQWRFTENWSYTPVNFAILYLRPQEWRGSLFMPSCTHWYQRIGENQWCVAVHPLSAG
jgi:hypothetical protein